MEFFEKKISNLVERQFPAFYAEEGPVFVQFVKAYYEWLESPENTIYHSRRLLEYRDIDTTIDSFLIHFKNKYLNSIQFDTAVDTRELVKHALDLYRSKGTERSVDLFFKAIFGVKSSVYYPAKDIFKTSSGQWIRPKYLELKVASNIKTFIGTQIEGIDSGATAFVEKYIRKKSKDSAFYNELYYISNIIGDFQTGERVRSTVTGEVGPVIIGSLNSLTTFDGSSGYAVGDIVDVFSENNGRDGKARVSSVALVSGVVTFEIENGGWGYNSGSQVIVSDKVLTVSNTINSGDTFSQFETVVQPLANVFYTHLAGDDLGVGDTLYKYYANGDTSATAVVLTAQEISNTTGYITVALVSNNFSDDLDILLEDGDLTSDEIGYLLGFDGLSSGENTYFYSVKTIAQENSSEISENILLLEDADEILFEEPVSTANVTAFVDVSITGNVVMTGRKVTLAVTNSTSQFADGDVIYQADGLNRFGSGTIDLIEYTGSNVAIISSNTTGYFKIGDTILSDNSGGSGIVSNITIQVGVFDLDGPEFFDVDGNILLGLASGTTGTVTRVSKGTGASFSIANTFWYEEIIGFNTDIIGDYFTVQLDAADYGLPSPGAEELLSIIGESLTYETDTYGKIANIILTNSGQNYDTAPMVVVFEPDLYSAAKRDFVVYIENPAGTFIIGEPVMQDGDIKGLIKEGSNNEVLFLERTTFQGMGVHHDFAFEDDDTLSTENGYGITLEQRILLYGTQSGFEADVTMVREDANTNILGLNAVIVANTIVANGYVSELEVIDSGFGYYDGEHVEFSTEGLLPGRAIAHLEKQGTGSGYWKVNNSTLSGNKYLQDGDYYQEFSYEIRSPIPLEKYENVLKDIIHIAGTKYFARFVLETELTSTANVGIDSYELVLP